MHITKFTVIGFGLNGALGSGKYNNISIEKIKSEILKNTIFDYLEKELSDDVDFSYLTKDDKSELNNEWESFVNNIDESRKLCVDKNGICLIMAYILEGIQERFHDMRDTK